MTLPTHLMAGLIVGKMTGNYPAAIITSIVFDLVHLFFYYTPDLLFRPFKVLRKALRAKVYLKGERGVFHSIFTWVLVSVVFMLINFPLGVTVASAYFLHLILDALDTSSFYPFYPFKGLNLHGPIIYASFAEVIFLAILSGVYYLIINFVSL
ncbi:MAG TPA: metal-dependent hydrolase [Patescibacteria group bacterium]|nr:metal-dependent hydrolase [Patescibacteria group bacterium]